LTKDPLFDENTFSKTSTQRLIQMMLLERYRTYLRNKEDTIILPSEMKLISSAFTEEVSAIERIVQRLSFRGKEQFMAINHDQNGNITYKNYKDSDYYISTEELMDIANEHNIDISPQRLSADLLAYADGRGLTITHERKYIKGVKKQARMWIGVRQLTSEEYSYFYLSEEEKKEFGGLLNVKTRLPIASSHNKKTSATTSSVAKYIVPKYIQIENDDELMEEEMVTVEVNPIEEIVEEEAVEVNPIEEEIILLGENEKRPRDEEESEECVVPPSMVPIVEEKKKIVRRICKKIKSN